MELAIANDKDVFAGAFANGSQMVERDAFGVAVGDGLHLDQLGVEVVAAGLGEGGQGIGRDPLPTGDADVYAIFECLGAQVLAPFPAGQVDVDRVLQRIDANLAIAAQRNRPDVARGQPVHRNQFHHRIGELGARERQVHAVNFAAVDQALGMFLQPENRRAGFRGIAADALKY